MIEISVPRLNTNDATYDLVEWLCEDGDLVRRADPVAVVETSKAAEEIVSPGDGILRRALPAPRQLAAGEVIGHLFATEEDLRRFRDTGPAPAPAPPAPPVPDGGPVVTGPAAALAAELGIDHDRLRALGLAVVRRADVAGLAAAARTLTLPRAQAAVAATVARSHATIPAAFTVVKVVVDAALALGREATRRYGALVGLPEIFVAAVGRRRPEFPLLFAEPVDERTVRPGPAHVGVTVDVGTGLYVPVVRDADRCGLERIAGTLARYRRTAMRDRFAEADLAGAAIMLTLPAGDDVVFNQPIVFPGQVCAVSVGAPLVEADGAAGNRTVVHLGAAYDHRYVNGGDAVRFLRAVRTAVEHPAALAHPAGPAPAGTSPEGPSPAGPSPEGSEPA